MKPSMHGVGVGKHWIRGQGPSKRHPVPVPPKKHVVLSPAVESEPHMHMDHSYCSYESPHRLARQGVLNLPLPLVVAPPNRMNSSSSRAVRHTNVTR
jgi:hypothetical protein